MTPGKRKSSAQGAEGGGVLSVGAPFQGQRLREECNPAGKEAVTGIAHEPWHFRYVGLPHAILMSREGWTLERREEFAGSSHEKITKEVYRR